MLLIPCLRNGIVNGHKKIANPFPRPLSAAICDSGRLTKGGLEHMGKKENCACLGRRALKGQRQFSTHVRNAYAI